MPGDSPTTSFAHLRRDGVSVLVAAEPGRLPFVAHWGADLGPLDDADARGLLAATGRQSAPGTLDVGWRVPIVPLEGDGWAGRPGAQLRRDGALVVPRWSSVAMRPGEASVEIAATSDGVELVTRIAVEAGGLVSVRHKLTNTGTTALDVDWLEAVMPVPRRADRLTSFDGRWSREKAPHTHDLPHGSTVRQTRRGRGGHDAAMLVALSDGLPRNRSGESWSVHLGWSGDTTYRVDRMTDAMPQIGAGELLRPQELRLAPDERTSTPDVYFAYSAAGWDATSDRFHTFLRSRPGHPSRPRPLTLNTWEAVYFDHDPDRLVRLAEVAASVGVERLVLDDGWFLGRRDDHAGLGDWHVDRTVWPDGLGPFARRVHELGMEFGLWFEPEMTNLDSDLARAHPDWLLHHRPLAEPPGVSWRDQYVLDLANPDAWSTVHAAIDALVSELGIDFIKWDHNRDLVEAEHDGRPGVHAQTLATYRLMATLKAAHPGLEIESCSSGGARTDLGVMAIADRVWASDSNDPVERQSIQRWTQLLLPPELVGSHVGPSPAHSSGRATDLGFRAATALVGSAGFEWDIAALADEERAEIARFAALYKELRPLLHTGRVVHDDLHDPAFRTVGVVARDGSEAVFTVATIATPADALTESFRLHGLDPEARYVVRVRDEIAPGRHGAGAPAWTRPGGIVTTGRALATVGLQLPTLWPAHALVVHATRVDRPAAGEASR